MCLVLKKNFRKKGKLAKKDLYCWKYFRRHTDSTLTTPVFRMPVKEEEGFLVTPVVDQPDISAGVVYGGVIHGAALDCDGLRFINENISETNPVVALMVIPKGTRYWVGCDGTVCAEKMLYLQTYKTKDNLDVGSSDDSFNDWYDEMQEWLIDN